MRRLVVAAAVAIGLLALPAAASAHPLGNFSVNHLTRVAVSSDRVDVRYVLDQAEIPTFQERGVPLAEVLRRKRAEVDRRLVVRVDGRRAALSAVRPPRLTRPRGQGGLATTRLQLDLRAPARGARRVTVEDRTFPERVGWRAVVAAPGRGTSVRSSAPAGDPTGGLRRYPRDLLASPADRRTATLAVAGGAGTLQAPDGRRTFAPGASGAGGASERGASGASRPSETGFTGLLEDAASGRGALVLLLLAAFGWGAVHALSPGHGKAMVAAYLVGTRGTARHALGLGLVVTATHTAGVFALGLVALALSSVILPEQLFPWLNFASGLLVVAVGAGVLRGRLRGRHGHHYHHHHPHDAASGSGISRRGLLAMGASAGLIPCPSALVVLLGAVAQREIGLGMLLIVAFSAGLAATLTAIGLAVVSAGRALERVPKAGRVAAVLPTISAVAIVAVGCLLTAQAVPRIA
jgi:ABC-type nickel/cobalt efflux system permease component RcnA